MRLRGLPLVGILLASAALADDRTVVTTDMSDQASIQAALKASTHSDVLSAGPWEVPNGVTSVWVRACGGGGGGGGAAGARNESASDDAGGGGGGAGSPVVTFQITGLNPGLHYLVQLGTRGPGGGGGVGGGGNQDGGPGSRGGDTVIGPSVEKYGDGFPRDPRMWVVLGAPGGQGGIRPQAAQHIKHGGNCKEIDCYEETINHEGAGGAGGNGPAFSSGGNGGGPSAAGDLGAPWNDAYGVEPNQPSANGGGSAPKPGGNGGGGGGGGSSVGRGGSGGLGGPLGAQAGNSGGVCGGGGGGGANGESNANGTNGGDGGAGWIKIYR